MHPPVRRNRALRRTGAVKTVGENLVNDTAGQPVRRFQLWAVGRYLPGGAGAGQRTFPAAVWGAEKPDGAPAGLQAKVVKVKARRGDLEVALPPLPVISIHSAPEHPQRHAFAGLVAEDLRSGGGAAQPARGIDFEMNCLPGGDSADGIAKNRIHRIKHVRPP